MTHWNFSKKLCNYTTPCQEVARALLGLRQGKRRVSGYAMEFRTLTAPGLADIIKDQLAPELSSDLDSLGALAIKIDNRPLEREKERVRTALPPPFQKGCATALPSSSWRSPPHLLSMADSSTPPPGLEEPMQMGRARLTLEEQQRH